MEIEPQFERPNPVEQREAILERKRERAKALGKRKIDTRGMDPNSLANLRTWAKGQSGNPTGVAGRVPGARSMVLQLFETAATSGKLDLAVDEYFELMLHSKDPRLRFDVLRDFFDRVGMPRVTDNPKVAAQIVNVVRSNSPDLNL